MLERGAAWVGGAMVVALCVLPLWPGGVDTPPEVAGPRRHFLAYAATAAVLAFGYHSPRQRLWLVGAGLVALGVVLEVGQLWAPGRTAQVSGAVGSGFGAATGVLAVFLMSRGRWTRPQKRHEGRRT